VSCGSGVFILDPDFFALQIPVPTTTTKMTGKNKLVVLPFFQPLLYSQNLKLF
jgi:hypothetical protein